MNLLKLAIRIVGKVVMGYCIAVATIILSPWLLTLGMVGLYEWATRED
jgi:hypothetical protein